MPSIGNGGQSMPLRGAIVAGGGGAANANAVKASLETKKKKKEKKEASVGGTVADISHSFDTQYELGKEVGRKPYLDGLRKHIDSKRTEAKEKFAFRVPRIGAVRLDLYRLSCVVMQWGGAKPDAFNAYRHLLGIHGAASTSTLRHHYLAILDEYNKTTPRPLGLPELNTGARPPMPAFRNYASTHRKEGDGAGAGGAFTPTPAARDKLGKGPKKGGGGAVVAVAHVPAAGSVGAGKKTKALANRQQPNAPASAHKIDARHKIARPHIGTVGTPGAHATKMPPAKTKPVKPSVKAKAAQPKRSREEICGFEWRRPQRPRMLVTDTDYVYRELHHARRDAELAPAHVLADRTPPLVDVAKILMSLKCGLATEATWAIDYLSVAILDQQFLNQIDNDAKATALVAVLTDHFNACFEKSSLFYEGTVVAHIQCVQTGSAVDDSYQRQEEKRCEGDGAKSSAGKARHKLFQRDELWRPMEHRAINISLILVALSELPNIAPLMASSTDFLESAIRVLSSESCTIVHKSVRHVILNVCQYTDASTFTERVGTKLLGALCRMMDECESEERTGTRDRDTETLMCTVLSHVTFVRGNVESFMRLPRSEIQKICRFFLKFLSRSVLEMVPTHCGILSLWNLCAMDSSMVTLLLQCEPMDALMNVLEKSVAGGTKFISDSYQERVAEIIHRATKSKQGRLLLASIEHRLVALVLVNADKHEHRLCPAALLLLSKTI